MMKNKLRRCAAVDMNLTHIQYTFHFCFARQTPDYRFMAESIVQRALRQSRNLNIWFLCSIRSFLHLFYTFLWFFHTNQKFMW